MHNQGYEIRKINGKDVFVKNIADNFWLFNNVAFYAPKDYIIDDEKIAFSLKAKDDIFLHYKGMEHKQFLGVSKLENGRFAIAEYPLDALPENRLINMVVDSYAEYRNWAGIC